MKVTKRTIVQKVKGKTIFHDKPFKNPGSSIAFMARHGIMPGTMIANGWEPPKGMQLQLEIDLIKRKKSNLSRSQRDFIQSTYSGQFL